MSALYITLFLLALLIYCIFQVARRLSITESIEVLKDAKQVENDMASISPNKLDELRAKWTRK